MTGYLSILNAKKTNWDLGVMQASRSCIFALSPKMKDCKNEELAELQLITYTVAMTVFLELSLLMSMPLPALGVTLSIVSILSLSGPYSQALNAHNQRILPVDSSKKTLSLFIPSLVMGMQVGALCYRYATLRNIGFATASTHLWMTCGAVIATLAFRKLLIEQHLEKTKEEQFEKKLIEEDKKITEAQIEEIKKQFQAIMDFIDTYPPIKALFEKTRVEWPRLIFSDWEGHPTLFDKDGNPEFCEKTHRDLLKSIAEGNLDRLKSHILCNRNLYKAIEAQLKANGHPIAGLIQP